MGPIPRDKCPSKRQKRRYRESGHVKPESETRMRLSPAKECLEPPEL